MAEYVIAIKSSARRHSRAAGQWVNREGPRRVFDSKALAREWARQVDDHRADGEDRHTGTERRVWVQDAAPTDTSGVDGYLVGGRRPPGARTELPDDQATVGAYDPD